MILIVSKYLVPKGFRGFSVFPFVFLRYQEDRADLVLLNHEKIHLRQQLELLVLPFFIWYVLEFGIRFLQFKKWNIAYRNISFEREAYQEESHLSFLEGRNNYNFLLFLNQK